MADIRDDEYISSLSGSQMDAALLDMAERTSEAWAVGERNGIDVSNIDPTYHNNAKYYAEQAARVVPTSGVPAVRYDTPQVLTETEQAQARANIGAEQKGISSNPNLLDNWWFGKSVINQRGQSSYTGRGYTIDRWDFGDPTGVLQVNNDYITLTSTGTGSGVTDFEQLLDLSEHIGKTLTVSVMMSDGTVRSGTAVFSTVNTGITVPIADGFTLNLGYYPSKSLNRVYIRNSGNRSGNSISIKAVKLEVSSISTLANDSAPNPATELLKCQRYFQRIVIAGTSPWNATTLRIDGAIFGATIPLLAPMRTNILGSMVSMTSVTSLSIGGGGNSVQVQSYTPINSGRNMAAVVYFTCNGTTIPYRTACVITGASGSEVTLSVSADL